MRIPTHIMLHHSLTADSLTVSWVAIQKYHIETQGWRDIGYHAGVELVTSPSDTSLWKYRYQALKGRSEHEQAAACPQGNMNSIALHVCCIGNFDLVGPYPDLLDCLVNRVLLDWMRRYGIPKENIVGHRDYNSAKTCPGKLFDIDLVRRLVS